MKPILDRLVKSQEINPNHGARIRYANPLNGGWVTPIMGAHLSMLPKSFKSKPYRSTNSTIYACVEGRGTTKVGDTELDWTPGDVFVVPSWKTHTHHAAEEAVLFGISDRPAQEALELARGKIEAARRAAGATWRRGNCAPPLNSAPPLPCFRIFAC